MLTKYQKLRKAKLHKIWARKNKVKRNLYRKEYLINNPDYRERIRLYLAKRRIEKPWLGHYDCARTRCTNKNRNSYSRYFCRGIKFRLTTSEVKMMWFRDKAYKLKRPSIDRIDVDSHYEVSNCRFIELSENCTKGNYEARWPR